MRILYDIFFTIFAIAYLPYFFIKRKGHKDLAQRFGIFDKNALKGITGNSPVWIHAVSVGEVKTSEGLIRKIRALFPSKRLVISTITRTGHDVALSFAAKDDAVIYLPLDISFVVKKTLNLINPSLFIIIETEIWPNLITELYAKKIPVVIVNGRISPKSFRSYNFIRPVMKDVLNGITLFAMRAKGDADRIIKLGAPAERVKVTGDMKFDMVGTSMKPVNIDFARGQEVYETSGDSAKQWLPVERRNLWLGASDKLIIAGSTHRGEDAKVLRAFKSLNKDFAEIRLLIAPRHIERADEIAALIIKFGFRPVRMSEIIEEKGVCYGGDCIFILDSIGRLKLFYQLADIVFMGGSLVPRGGHNFVEPALYAKPIITGPFVHNFRDMSELFIKERALEMVKNGQELECSLRRLILDEKERRRMGESAKKAVLDNAGSTERNCLLITEMMDHAQF